MAKKLSEDQIKWILSLDVSEAEEGYHKLRQENKQLEERNKEVKKSLRELEKAGKQTGEAYTRLSAELTENNKKLATNREMTKKLSLQMGVTNMTMTQLKRHAADLQKQLDNTSEALHPEEYAKLNAQLTETKSRMNELKGVGKHVEESVSSVLKSRGTFMAMFGNLYTKGLEVGAKLLGQGVDFIKQGKEMAASADGISRAFNGLDQPGLLQNLRAATKGTVSDLELMKAAVKAKDFQIPLEDLGKYLQFAQLKAQQTGESVEFLTESIVTGLGRQSVQILDNLGLSASEINAEVSKTGDFMQGVANIVEKQLAQAGEQYVSAADKVQQRSVTLQNIQLSIGQRFLSMSQGIDSVWTGILKAVDKFVAIPAEQKIRVERQEVNQLAGAILSASGNTEIRNKLIKEMNQKYPDFLKNLDLEKLTNEQLITRLRDVNQEYSKRIRMQVLNDKVLAPVQEKEKKLTEEQMDIYKSLAFAVETYGHKMSDSFREAIKNGSVVNLTTEQLNQELQKMEKNGVAKGFTRGSWFSAGLEDDITRLKQIPQELQNVQTEIEKTMSAINGMSGTSSSGQGTPPASGTNPTETPVTGGTPPITPTTSVVAQQLAEQTRLYEEAQIALKERYLSGQDEELQCRSEFNAAMQQLLMDDLNARLAIMGLEPEQRRQLEQQLLDIKVKALEDFRTKRLEFQGLEQNDRLADNQKALDDAMASAHEKLRLIQENQQKQIQIIQASLQQQVEQYKGYGSQIGTALGNVLSGQEDMVSAFGNTMIDILFDVLSQIINQKIAEATAVAVAEQAKAAAISAAQPDSVVTFGASAAARTAVIGGLIMAALTAAKTALKGLLTKKGTSTSNVSSAPNATYTRVAGREQGGAISVTRVQDGKFFSNVRFDPMARGFITRPTVIVGEGAQSREWVASNAAVMNPTVAPILSIIDQAQQAGTIRSLDLNKYLAAYSFTGRERGGDVVANGDGIMPAQPIDSSLMNRFVHVLELLESEGIPSFVLLDELEKKQSLRDRSRKIGRK